MPSYLVETFLPRSRASEQAACESRASSAAREVTDRRRIRVRFERSIYVPEDEICFFVFDAPAARDAALVAQRAELDAIRVVEAIASGADEPRATRARTTSYVDERRRP